MSAALAGWGMAAPGDPLPGGVDPAPLRRMDRYGRCGFVAGSRALAAAGRSPGAGTDARAGAVFGTAFGCRDSITEHAGLLARARSVEDLRPAVFVQTVHNSVNGELAIAWGLGGPAETLVSGRCAGLEALILAARFVEEGAADAVLAGAAEGLDAAMERAWEREKVRFGPGEAAQAPLDPRGAALVLAPEAALPSAPRLLFGTAFFAPDGREALRRALEALAPWGVPPEAVVPGAPDLEGLLAGSAFAPAPRAEAFAAGGLLAAVRVAEALREGRWRRGAVLVRDPEGPVAVVVLGNC